MKKALITGITGQDGSYLTELLLGKEYEVNGITRRASTNNRERIDKSCNSRRFNERLRLHEGDVTDAGFVCKLVREIEPDEIYNLAAQSHVGTSFTIPDFTIRVDAIGPLNILEAIRVLGLENKARFYQASSSEMYGKVIEIPEKETTPFNPQSPYACAKVMAFSLTQLYRRAYEMFAVNGILFNHESPRRGENFVTRKITKGITSILSGEQDKLYLGNIDAKRDWGYAPDYVKAMWLMLQQDNPDDYVIATGETHTVKEFLEEGFSLVGLDYKDYVEINQSLVRPGEVDILLGDSSKARKNLGWQPRVTFKELVRIMLEHDLKEKDLENRLVV